MTDKNPVPIDVQEYVKNQVQLLVDGTRIEKITDQLQRENANELSKQLQGGRIDMEAKRKELKDPFLKKGQAVDTYFKKPIEQIKAVETNLNRVMWDYDEEQRAKVEAERLAEEKRVQDEKDRLFKIEEKKRREVEEEQKRARLLKEKAEHEQNEKKKARLAKEAAAAEDKANRAFEAANKKADQAENVESNTLTPQYNKPKGVTGKKVYKGEFYDAAGFIKWCVSNGKFHWLLINEDQVNKSIAAEGNNWKAPGVRVIEDTKIQFSAGRRTAEKRD